MLTLIHCCASRIVHFVLRRSNDMCCGYWHFRCPRDLLDTGRSLELASIFPKCSDGLDKPSYSWSDHQWVLTDLPLPVSSISQTFSLDRWWFIRCELISALQLFKHTKSARPPLLPHFPPVIAQKEQNAAILSAKVKMHNVKTLYVLCCKFAYEIKLQRCSGTRDQ